MHSRLLAAAGHLALANIAVVLAANERVIGVYMFHRHGDRTAKAWNPVSLTALGANEVYSSGNFYHSRYVDSNADFRIAGLSSDTPVLSQLEVTSPKDVTLHNSAVVFLQGFYPPSNRTETLANGTKVEAPLGYQYIPVDSVGDAATANQAESTHWLQGGSGCTNAAISSNNYFASPEYKQTYEETKVFYQSLLPVINGTYDATAANFKNGYSIYDLINVATIHNSSIPADTILTKTVLSHLYNLASVHEWNLAYNSSEPVRAIAGSVLASQILDALQRIVDGRPSTPKFHAQFGAYGTIMSFFGLAQLPEASKDFYGICNYASSMTFELFTTSTDANPKADDISVRFLWSNGTASQHGVKSYPLFGQGKDTLSWNDFRTGMAKFAIADAQHWCQLCGVTDGKCASNSTVPGRNGPQKPSSGETNITTPVAGVVGALVSLAVILGVGALVMLVFRLRIVHKCALAAGGSGGEVSEIGDGKSK